MVAIRHENNGNCFKCKQIFDKYPGTTKSEELERWFFCLQFEVPEAHISEAGRNKADQLAAHQRKASKALWRQSAHNFKGAVDIFRLIKGRVDYAEDWFNVSIKPRLTDDLDWYGLKINGKFVSSFPEMPHVQLKGWKKMVVDGLLKPVEDVK
jgi:hypothetical protein